MLGPVFAREFLTAPRSPRHYLYRVVFVLAQLVLMGTAWMVITGTQLVRNLEDMARFGSLLFQIIAPVQLAVLVFLSALGAASAVSQEKDRRTLVLLLLTRITNTELVLGKLTAGMLNVFVLLLAELPVLMLITLFGGVSFEQVARVMIVTACSSVVAGSLGSTFAFWREKTFQTLAMTTLVIVLWVTTWEVVHSGVVGKQWGGVSCETVAAALSPVRALVEATRPAAVMGGTGWLGAVLGGGVLGSGLSFVISSLVAIVALNGIAIACVRVWNPSREVRAGMAPEAESSIWGVEHDLAQAEGKAEAARAGHVDSVGRRREAGRTREVWDNPVLWREVCTWAYGRKVLVIKIAYIVLAVIAVAGLSSLIRHGKVLARQEMQDLIPDAAKPLAPFLVVSLVIVNALAVNAVTNERDGQALDLLLVTDLTPAEFIFGKLLGVLWVTKEMVLFPLALCGYLWWSGGVQLEHLAYLVGGALVMYAFVTMLGVHSGLTYASSRVAIGTSLGTVFFLFLGVATCMMIMVSFSGSFQTQLFAFSFLILGGGAGLFASLGSRNPSGAILTSSLLLPFLTFFAITSFILKDRELTVFLVIAVGYGFTTAAMMVPALYEFDIAMGRAKLAADE